MVPDANVYYNTPRIRDRPIVSKREYSNIRYARGQKGLGPWIGRGRGCPSVFAVAGQAVDENNAEAYRQNFLPSSVHETYSATAGVGGSCSSLIPEGLEGGVGGI